MEKRELRTIGEFPYGLHTYEVLYDPVDKVWFVRNMDKGTMYEVFQGDIEVEWVRDAIIDEAFFVVKTSGVVVYDTDIFSVIRKLRKAAPANIRNHYFLMPFLKTITKERRDNHLFGGFYAEGFVEGAVPYPAVSWDCEPRSLEAMTKYIIESFPPLNRANALANVALAIAKVLSPGIRFAVDRVFEDRVVINTPDLYPNLRNLFLSIIDLLGLDPGEVFYGWDRPVTNVRVLRDLLMSSTAPLFLSEVDKRGLGVVLRLGLAAAFADYPIDIEPKHGVFRVFHYYNLRSVMVNTVLDHREVERQLTMHFKYEGELEWALRRMTIIKWSPMPMRRSMESFSGRPILGCLKELWQDQGFRSHVLSDAWSIEDLAVMVMEAFRTRYGVDTSPYAEALKLLVEGQEENEREVRRQRPEDLVVLRMYEIARQVLGVTNISVYQVLKAVVEDPGKFDVKVTGSKWKYMVERDMKEWEGLVRELGLAPEGLAVQPSDPRFGALGDTEKALAFVWWLIAEKKLNRIIIYANSEHGLMQGSPRQLFGSPRGIYNGRKGYSVSWVAILRHMLSTASVSTGKGGNEGSAVGTEKP